MRRVKGYINLIKYTQTFLKFQKKNANKVVLLPWLVVEHWIVSPQLRVFHLTFLTGSFWKLTCSFPLWPFELIIYLSIIISWFLKGYTMTVFFQYWHSCFIFSIHGNVLGCSIYIFCPDVLWWLLHIPLLPVLIFPSPHNTIKWTVCKWLLLPVDRGCFLGITQRERCTAQHGFW